MLYKTNIMLEINNINVNTFLIYFELGINSHERNTVIKYRWTTPLLILQLKASQIGNPWNS